MEIYQHGLLVNQGGTHHRHHRAVFTAPFTRANVEREMTAVVAGHAERLIAALPDDGEVDWVAEVARPMPLSVFAELFALPAADTDWIFERVHEDSVAFDVLLDPALVPDTDIKRGEQAMLELRSYLSDLAGQRRGEPGADLLSVMIVSAAERGDLSWDDGLSQSMEALTAGTGTTQALLNGVIEAFSAHPDEWSRWRRIPTCWTRDRGGVALRQPRACDGQDRQGGLRAPGPAHPRRRRPAVRIARREPRSAGLPRSGSPRRGAQPEPPCRVRRRRAHLCREPSRQARGARSSPTRCGAGAASRSIRTRSQWSQCSCCARTASSRCAFSVVETRHRHGRTGSPGSGRRCSAG